MPFDQLRSPGRVAAGRYTKDYRRPGNHALLCVIGDCYRLDPSYNLDDFQYPLAVMSRLARWQKESSLYRVTAFQRPLSLHLNLLSRSRVGGPSTSRRSLAAWRVLAGQVWIMRSAASVLAVRPWLFPMVRLVSPWSIWVPSLPSKRPGVAFVTGSDRDDRMFYASVRNSESSCCRTNSG
jgi:hypothetical protein